MSEVEEWRPVPDWEGYEVSNIGRVRSWRMAGNMSARRTWPRVRVPQKRPKGHLSVRLSIGERGATKGVHQLVMAAFVGPVPEGKEVAHNNGIPSDNRLENLRYATRSENRWDRLLHGTHNRGEEHSLHILTEAQVCEARARCRGGETRGSVAKTMGVSVSTIRAAVSGQNWAWLKDEAA